MTPDRWRQVKEIFHSALQYEPAKRSIFVSSACGGDESLRKEVESLISSHEKDGTFMDSPAYAAVAETLVNDQELKPGQKIASYEVISFISATQNNRETVRAIRHGLKKQQPGTS